MKAHLKISNYWCKKHHSSYHQNCINVYIKHIENNCHCQFIEHNVICLTDENKFKMSIDNGDEILPAKYIIEKMMFFYKFKNI